MSAQAALGTDLALSLRGRDFWHRIESLEFAAVETERNEQRRGIAWHFTSRDARRKLERLYPVKEAESV